MDIYYSASTRGFYIADIHGESMPADKVALDIDSYHALLDGQSKGKLIVPGEDGFPVLLDATPEPEESARSRTLVERDARLNAVAIRIAPLQDAVDLGVATEDDVSNLTAWKRYRVALHRIEQAAGFPLDFDWPELPGQEA